MGCRKFKGRQWLDDLDGQTYLPEDLEEIVFVLDGEAKVIHLNRANADAFREAMGPYVDAAQPTTKSKVLSTLPRKKRHLSIVPSVEDREGESSRAVSDLRSLTTTPVENDVQAEPENTSFPHKGEAVEALPEPEGTRVPEAPSKPSDSSPVLSVVRDDNEDKRKPWLPMAPHSKDDQQAKVFKVRKWATAMGLPPQKPLTPEMFERWEAFYITQGWLNL